MKILYLLSVWLHILAAMTWLGGMLFFVIVLVPVTRHPAYREVAGELVQRVGVRFRWLGWLCFGLLIATGTVNLINRGVTWASLVDAHFWNGSFGRTLGMKLFLVAIILAASAYHDFYVGPEATAAWQAMPNSSRARRLRLQARWMGRINLLLALLVVALAVILVRGWV
ncbi:MAG: DUF4149 domain-containing protein [Caldilineaceae bacterium]